MVKSGQKKVGRLILKGKTMRETVAFFKDLRQGAILAGAERGAIVTIQTGRGKFSKALGAALKQIESTPKGQKHIKFSTRFSFKEVAELGRGYICKGKVMCKVYITRPNYNGLLLKGVGNNTRQFRLGWKELKNVTEANFEIPGKKNLHLILAN